MTKKNKPDRQDLEKPAGPAIGKQGHLKDPQGPGKQDLNPGNQGPHGSGEGLTGMQPGAGHPRGR